MRSVFNDEKKLSIAELSQTFPARLIEQVEAQRAPRPSPIAAIYGSTEAFAQECMEGVASGKLCGTDMPGLLDCLRRWDREGSWGVRRTSGNGVWNRA